VVVESIIQLLNRDPRFKILACTPSNAAADLLVERLAAAGLDSDQLFRLNAYSRYEEDISEGVQEFSVYQNVRSSWLSVSYSLPAPQQASSRRRTFQLGTSAI
jgi:hypothetical protein